MAKADPGFVDPYRSLRADDLTMRKKKRIREIVSCRSGSKRFLGKYTGWSMIPYMKEAFPKAKFIHIIRDGRAVVNSFLHLPGWRGWEGIHNWRWGYKEEYQEEIDRYDGSFAAIAALQWKMVTKEIKKNGEKIGDDFMELRYEEMIDRPIDAIKKTVEFTGENFDKRMKKVVSSHEFKNMNYKWKKNLSSRQKEVVQDSLNQVLKEYGYG